MSQQQEQVNDPNGGDNGRDGDGGGDGETIKIQPSGTQSRLSTIRQTVDETFRPERITTLRTLICDWLACDSTCCTNNEDDIKTPEDSSNNREDSSTDQQRPRMSAARANLYKNTEPAQVTTTLRTLICDCLACDCTCCPKNKDDIKTPEDSSNNREESSTDQQRPRMSAARANLFKNTEPAQVATTTRYGTVALTDSATQTDTTTPIDTTTPVDSTSQIETITQTDTSIEAGSSPSSSSGSSSRSRRCEVAGQTKPKKTLEDLKHKAHGSLSTIGESVTSSESKDSKVSGSEVGNDDKPSTLGSTEKVEDDDDGKVEDGEPKKKDESDYDDSNDDDVKSQTEKDTNEQESSH